MEADPSKNESPGLSGIDQLFKTQSSSVILEITKMISRKLDVIIEKQKNLRTELTTTRQQGVVIKHEIETMRKQLLYRFNSTSVPVIALPKIRSVWDIQSMILVEFDPQLCDIIGYSLDELQKGFVMMRLFPKFFQPFAMEFISKLNEYITKDCALAFNTGTVSPLSQMVFIVTGDNSEIPVLFECTPFVGHSEEKHLRLVTIQIQLLAFN